MNEGSAKRPLATVAFSWVVSWAALAAVWMLLVDNTRLPELLTGVVAAAIGATGSELVRIQRIAGVRPKAAWLLRAWRPVARAPLDVLVVVREVLAQVVRPRERRGELIAVPFAHGGGEPRDRARRALAEGLGSFAPNTIVVGIDEERDVILVHQLASTDDPRKSADPLDLG